MTLTPSSASSGSIGIQSQVECEACARSSEVSQLPETSTDTGVSVTSSSEGTTATITKVRSHRTTTLSIPGSHIAPKESLSSVTSTIKYGETLLSNPSPAHVSATTNQQLSGQSDSVSGLQSTMTKTSQAPASTLSISKSEPSSTGFASTPTQASLTAYEGSAARVRSSLSVLLLSFLCLF